MNNKDQNYTTSIGSWFIFVLSFFFLILFVSFFFWFYFLASIYNIEVERTENSGMDQFSDLPEPNIHDIMFLLPSAEPARMSVLSKSLSSASRSFPIVDFNLVNLGRELLSSFWILYLILLKVIVRLILV